MTSALAVSLEKESPVLFFTLCISFSAFSINKERSVSYSKNPKPKVPLEYFSNVPFLLLTNTNNLRVRALAICHENQFTPNIRFQAEQLETAYYLAAHGLGATFISDVMIREHHFPNLVFYPIDSPVAVRIYHAVIHKHSYLSRHMETFIDLARKTWKGKSNYCIDD